MMLLRSRRLSVGVLRGLRSGYLDTMLVEKISDFS